MTNDVVIAVLAAFVGIAVGALMMLRRQPTEQQDPDAVGALDAQNALNAQLHAELTARLEVQAAELRRIADASGQRDVSADHLRAGLEATRHALEQLQVRDEERRTSETEHREVVRRLATVLAGGTPRAEPGSTSSASTSGSCPRRCSHRTSA